MTATPDTATRRARVQIAPHLTATRASAHWANLFLLIASGGMVFVPAVRCGRWHLVPVGSPPRPRDRL